MPQIIKILFFLFLSSQIFAQETNGDNLLLWEISGNKAKEKSYLFGSFHTNDKRVFELGDSTYYALQQADAIVLETDVFQLFESLDTRTESPRVFYDSSGKPYTASKKAGKTLYGDEDGMPQFLDAYFQQYCYNAGKRFYPLESVSDQMEVTLPSNLPEFGAKFIEQDRILETYLSGDIYALDRIMRAALTIYGGLYDELIIQRNFVMANGIDSLIQQQKVFAAVGAGHLAGDLGIISLLSKKGYTVRKVEFVQSAENTHKKAVLQKNSYSLNLPSYKLHATFAGKPQKFTKSRSSVQYIYREMGQGNTYSMEIFPCSERITLEETAEDYIRTPRTAKITYATLDDGTHYAEGISNTYPDGLTWVRIIESSNYNVVLRAFGGNKFMHSKRPQKFFNQVGFEW